MSNTLVTIVHKTEKATLLQEHKTSSKIWVPNSLLQKNLVTLILDTESDLYTLSTPKWFSSKWFSDPLPKSQPKEDLGSDDDYDRMRDSGEILTGSRRHQHFSVRNLYPV